MDRIREKLGYLPDSPGVYIMKNEQKEIIYVGKAVSLNKRVRQYFQSSRNQSPKVNSMVENIYDFEYIMTDSEVEALILECNLIKQHRPRYNILLKDDKSYPYIKITTQEEYPRILFTRDVKRDNNKYFGPYTSAGDVRQAIDALRGIFPLRSCNKSITGQSINERPCLYFHISKCLAPCQGKVDVKEYTALVEEVGKFLEGKHKQLIKELTEKMQRASENLQFEKAAILRDRIKSVNNILEKQKISAASGDDRDVIACTSGENESMVQLFQVRGGKLIAAKHFLLKQTEEEQEKTILNSYVKQFYSITQFIPKQILLSTEIAEMQVIEEWLSKKRGNRVTVKVPVRGEKRRLVDMAVKNANEALDTYKKQKQRKYNKTMGAVKELSEYLDMDELPLRIEGFDISNIQGTNTVASMVVFENGEPKKKDYRRFKIKSVEGIDDVASMLEVITRRFRHGLEEIEKLKSSGRDIKEGSFSKLPDLVLIDGGKGQLSSALSAVRSLGVTQVEFISIAKKFEEIYTEYSPKPINIPKDSQALKLLQRIRDESHRFAITYHRSLRRKSNMASILEDIPDIGPKRRKALLKRFKSVDEISKASLEELTSVQGMTKAAAQSIQEYIGNNS